MLLYNTCPPPRSLASRVLPPLVLDVLSGIAPQSVLPSAVSRRLLGF